MIYKDIDGKIIKSGDNISFSYGIPGVTVLAKVTGEYDEISVSVPPPHKPSSCTLKYLLKNFNVYKEKS